MPKVNIDVAVRVRPICEDFKSLTYTQHAITLRGVKNYRFSKVLTPDCKQSELFEECKLGGMVDRALEGYNSTVMAFGQTGAGKTYTMEGMDDKKNRTIGTPPSGQQEGIIPRSIRTLYERLKTNSVKFRVSCSFLQIYNERIYDLLSPNVGRANPFLLTNRDFNATVKMGLKMRWDRNNEFSVQNLQNRVCANSEDMLKVWSEGLKNRVVAATRLNLSSSRSHTIFTIKLQLQSPHQVVDVENQVYSRLEFVDLAGSQRIMGDGRQLKQSIDINKSLFTLRKVINSLESKQVFVPYRESKLTSLLKQSFGGNNYCLFVACINPADSCTEQSIVTLDYTTKASFIENRVERRSDKRDIVIEQLKRQNETLRAQLTSCYKQLELLGRFNTAPTGQSSSPSNRRSPLPQLAVRKSQSPPPSQAPHLAHPCTSNKQLNIQTDVSVPQKQQSPPTQFADKNIYNRYKEQVRIDYEYFGQRLVESINTVRELLKSNKKLREQLDQERARCEQYASEMEQLMMENERLKGSSCVDLSIEREPNVKKTQVPTERSIYYRKLSNFKTRNIRIATEHSREEL